ncbi:MAG: hypothetical protein ACEQSE_07760 [Candidatus Aquirickettsiella gammari]
MKSLLKFGGLLLSFGLILSVLGIMIIRAHAVPDQAVKAVPAPAANSAIVSSAPKS